LFRSFQLVVFFCGPFTRTSACQDYAGSRLYANTRTALAADSTTSAAISVALLTTGRLFRGFRLVDISSAFTRTSAAIIGTTGIWATVRHLLLAALDPEPARQFLPFFLHRALVPQLSV
jgi:hypothetical protein